VTSALVIAEGHSWFLRWYDRHRAAEFRAFVESLPALAVQAFDATELSKVRRMLAKFGDQTLTLAGAHGLVIMKDRRSAVCCARGPASGPHRRGSRNGVLKL
jgi:hypothetical protein